MGGGGTGKSGSRVIVPYRDEDDKRHLKVMGDLGQIIPLVSTSSDYFEWYMAELGLTVDVCS